MEKVILSSEFQIQTVLKSEIRETFLLITTVYGMNTKQSVLHTTYISLSSADGCPNVWCLSLSGLLSAIIFKHVKTLSWNKGENDSIKTHSNTNHCHCQNWHHPWTRDVYHATPTCWFVDVLSQLNFPDEPILAALSAVLQVPPNVQSLHGETAI